MCIKGNKEDDDPPLPPTPSITPSNPPSHPSVISMGPPAEVMGMFRWRLYRIEKKVEELLTLVQMLIRDYKDGDE